MSDRERDLLALRTIEVSARVALRRAPDIGPEGVEQVRRRATQLLDRLEEQVIAQGADGEVLAAVEYVRQSVRDARTPTTAAPGEWQGAGRVH